MYQFIESIELNQFQQFAQKHPLASIYQTIEWPKIKSEWKYDLIGIMDDNQIIAGAMILFRPLAWGLSMAYLPRGPLLDYTSQATLNFFFENLKTYCKKRNVIVCKFDPNILIYQGHISDKKTPHTAKNEALVQSLAQAKTIFQGYSTHLADAIQPRYQLCFSFHENWKNDIPKKTLDKINSSFNKGVSVVINPRNAVSVLSNMVTYTELRKHIFLRNEAYFQSIINTYQDDASILIAKINHLEILIQLEKKLEEIQALLDNLIDNAPKRLKQYSKQKEDVLIEIDKVKQQQSQDGDEVIISALLLVKNTTTCELLYSGLNENYRRYLCAYSLRIRAMEWADEQGCRRFNFGGVQGNLEDGLFTFKASFNPNIEVYLGEFDLPISSLLYPLWKHALPIAKSWMKNIRERKI